MRDALVAGLLVGLAVAVFVAGPAMFVMETAAQRGLGVALAAGGGIATGDAVWAAVAAGAGLSLSRLLLPWVTALQWISVGALVMLLMFGVRELRRRESPASVGALSASPWGVYREFLTHTLRHSVTLVFFVSLIIGAAPRFGAAGAAAFTAGVFLASLSWQLLLAAVGRWCRRPFSGRARRGVLALDCVLLAVYIAYVGLGLYRS